MAVTDTGLQKPYIDLLLYDDLQSVSWSGTNETAVPSTINYATNLSTWSNALENQPGNTTTISVPDDLSSGEAGSLKDAIEAWEAVASVNFTEITSGTPSVVFRKASEIEYQGEGTDSNIPRALTFVKPASSGDLISWADVVFDQDILSSVKGNPGYTTYLHEAGHAMFALDDPTGTVAAALDRQLSVMSLNYGTEVTSSRSAVTPMIYDIAAAQHLYGPNSGYHDTATNYVYDPNVTAFDGTTITGQSYAWTIWDSGGVDSIDATAATAAVKLDLRGGVKDTGNAHGGTELSYADDEPYFSSIGNERIAIAFDPRTVGNGGSGFGTVNIENAKGGSGADTLHGGGGDNTLEGNAGQDKIYSFGGYDTLKGGADTDTFYFGKFDASRDQQAVIYTGTGLTGGVVNAFDTDAVPTHLSGAKAIYFNEAGNTKSLEIRDNSATTGPYNQDTTHVSAKGPTDVAFSAGNDTFAYNLGLGAEEVQGAELLSAGLNDSDKLFFGSQDLSGIYSPYQVYNPANGYHALWQVSPDLWFETTESLAYVKVYHTDSLVSLGTDGSGKHAYTVASGAPDLLRIDKEGSGVENNGTPGDESDDWINLPFGIRLDYNQTVSRPNAAPEFSSTDVAWNISYWDSSGLL